MSTTPKVLTVQEIKEIAELFLSEEAFPDFALEEIIEDIKTGYAFKIEKYVTLGPGFAGPLYVIIGAYPDTAITIERHNDGTLRAYYLNND
jgi:hypothetical protein